MKIFIVIIFQICGCIVNDCSEYGLQEWLKVGLPNSYDARGMHNSFAALIYCIQFVNSLIRLLDICIPTQVRNYCFYKDFANQNLSFSQLSNTPIHSHSIVVTYQVHIFRYASQTSLLMTEYRVTYLKRTSLSSILP